MCVFMLRIFYFDWVRPLPIVHKEGWLVYPCFIGRDEQLQLVVYLCSVQECELAWCFAPSLLVYFFTAARSFALRARGL